MEKNFNFVVLALGNINCGIFHYFIFSEESFSGVFESLYPSLRAGSRSSLSQMCHQGEPAIGSQQRKLLDHSFLEPCPSTYFSGCSGNLVFAMLDLHSRLCLGSSCCIS